MTILFALLAGNTYLNIQSRSGKQHLVVSSTTSLYETGFLDYLKTKFESNYPNINVSFISQGTGLAIRTAMRGDADMILVHDPERELTFMKDGYGVNRKVIAYNFFLIVGPKEDPARIKNLSPVDALKAIQVAGLSERAQWISRGDDSGTHAKEKNLWIAAGFDVNEIRQQNWYIEAGSGMTATLKMADEKSAYTLTDLGTYLTNYRRGNISLDILVEAGKELLNVYSIIATDPRHENLTRTNFQASMTFIKFLVSEEGQQLFDSYGNEEYGQSLFKPYVELLRTGSNSIVVEWIQQTAYFDGSECPSIYRYEEEDLYMVAAQILVADKAVNQYSSMMTNDP
jgi:tungstate transport system substrate-binding protein